MKILLPLAASLAFSGTIAAQQLTPLPLSADLTLTTGSVTPAPAPSFGGRATTACDDFNRASLGADWVPYSGSPALYSNMLGSGGGISAVQHATASANYDASTYSFDLPDNPTILTYGAAMHGLGGSTNLFTKVQSQQVGAYATIGFYVGNNGGSGYSGGGFFGITPVLGGWVDIYIDPASSGDTVVIDIDENRDGVVDYTYTATGVNGISGGFGTDIGLGIYGSAFGSLDDFELNGGCAPQGPSLTLVCAAGSVTADMNGFTPSAPIAVVYGPAAPFVAPGPACAGLALDLNPMAGPIIVIADGNGDAQIVQGVNPAVCGSGILVQAVDVPLCLASNSSVL